MARLNTQALSTPLDDFRGSLRKFVINLFPDLEPTGILVHVEQLGLGRWTGSGRIEGEPGSQFVIAVSQGHMASTVFIPSKGHFRILPGENQRHDVMEIDHNLSGLCGTCNQGVAKSPALLQQAPTRVSSKLSSHSIPPEQPPFGTAKVSIVDLMVVYTPAALAGAGGTGAIETLIDLAVAEANTIHQNSRTTARFRLVYQGPVNYLEVANLSTNLSRLQVPNDGFMDEVHTIRTANHADIVCLITETSEPGISGLAFMMTDPSAASFRDSAFAVVKRSNAVGGGYAFTHELGHVLGCQHDREHALSSDQKLIHGAYPDSFGFRFEAGGATYRTVMAYSPGIPIPYFSNPSVSYLGVPLGVAVGAGVTNASDNARTISVNAGLASAFLGPVVQTFAPQVSLTSPAADAEIAAGDTLTLTASASDSDGSISRVEFYADSQIVGVTTTSPYRVVWSQVPAGVYELTARAVDNLGATSMATTTKLTARPRNDDLASSSTLLGPTPVVSGSNRAATQELGEPRHSNNAGGSSVWYVWTAPKSGSVRLWLTSVGFTPLPGAYRGTTVGELVSVTQSTSFENTSATAQFDAVSGTTYAIAVDGAEGASGDFNLSLKFLEPPVNDDFANRIVIAGTEIEIQTHNDFATTETGESPQYSGNPGGKSIWHEWMAPRSGTVMIQCKAFGIIILQEAYLGTKLTGLTLVTNRRFEPDQARHSTLLTFDAAAGQTYQLVAAGLGGASGAFAFKLVMPPPPSNDDFSNAALLIDASLRFASTTSYATTEPGEGRHGGQATGKSIWYAWTAPRTGPVIIKSQGATSNFLPITDVYVGTSVTNVVLVSGRTVALVISNQISTVSFSAISNQTYAVVIAGFSSVTGDFEFTLDMPSPPANDDFENRIPMTGVSWSVDAVNVYSSSEVGETNHAENEGGRSIWYAWTAPVSGPVTVTATGDGFIALVDVYSGTEVSKLSRVSRTIKFPTTNFVTTLTFNARYSTNYAIALDGFKARTGRNTLALAASNSPPLLSLPTGASFTSTDFSLDVTGSAGTKFVVQASTDLQAWIDIWTASFVTDRYHFIDTNAPTIPLRFYRALPRP